MAGDSPARKSRILLLGVCHPSPAPVTSPRILPMKRSALLRVALVLAAALAPARADEGMWTFNNFPVDKVDKAYGFRPDARWLDHVRLSSAQLGGCSAAFVSARGLVQTNHHCAVACIEQLSSAERNMVADGFYAREEKDEIKCPAMETSQLIGISTVTERIRNAVSGRDGPAYAAALKAEKTRIESECVGGEAHVHCNVVELYHGGVYDLYKYRRYEDVRLVFAPEGAIAFFGGDPDNFEFPRYDFDVAYLRVYVDGKPLDTGANFLRYAAVDAKDGDLVFTSGTPGATNRLDTVAQLAFRRDVLLPRDIFWNAEWRGVLTQFSTEGRERARIARTMLFGVENRLKAQKGQLAALVDPRILADHAAAEAALRAKIDADPALRAQYGAAWDEIARTIERYRAQSNRFFLLAGNAGFSSRLMFIARTLVRHAAEAAKPESERLREFTDANFPALRQRLLSVAPIHPELDKLQLAFSLTKLRELLGPDDPFVRKVLGHTSPEALAAELVDGSQLADLDLRKRLLDADVAAIAASNDPMIRFALDIDPDLRAARTEFDDHYVAALTKQASLIAQARFKIEGTSTYPDATASPRLSYGAVRGYSVDGRAIAPVTRVRGLYARATGVFPFRLPPTWTAAQPALNPEQPFNFATTNDIIGGNSGSPVIDRNGDIVGLIFDGNIQSLGGAFGDDPTVNRAVAVSVGILREGLAKVYHADRLVEELGRSP
jgi:hypothetical protein